MLCPSLKQGATFPSSAQTSTALSRLARTARHTVAARRVQTAAAAASSGDSGSGPARLRDWSLDGTDEDSAAVEARSELRNRRYRQERLLLQLESELCTAAREDKDSLLDRIDEARLEFDHISALVAPHTVNAVLSSFVTLRFINAGDKGFAELAEAHGLSPLLEKMHAAQDVTGRWRILEDKDGRPLSAPPACMTHSVLASTRTLFRLGFFINATHQAVPPKNILSFAGCRSWEEVQDALKAAQAQAAVLARDGWLVDNASHCADAAALMLMKPMPAMRTLQHDAAELAARQAAEEARSAAATPARRSATGRRRKAGGGAPR